MAHVQDYDDIRDHVEGFEGRRGAVYTDTEGHPTFGIGFNLNRGDADAKLRGLGLDPADVREGGRVALGTLQCREVFEHLGRAPALAGALLQRRVRGLAWREAPAP